MSFISKDGLGEGSDDEDLDSSDDPVNYVDYHLYVQHRDAFVTMRQGDRLADVAE